MEITKKVTAIFLSLALAAINASAQNADTTGWQARLKTFNQHMQQLDKISISPPVSRKRYDSVRNVQATEAKAFVLANTDNPAGVSVFVNNFYGEQDGNKLLACYNLFTPAMRQDTMMKLMKGLIDTRLSLVPGKAMPGLSGITDKGKPISLAGYKGKYVMLDFWGTWCTSCIEGFPRMKEYAHRYQRSLQMISIAVKDNEKDWKAGLAKSQLPWPQLLDKNPGDTTSLARRFCVMQFPTKMLIGPDSKIIGIYVGESDEVYKKLDSLNLKE